MKSKTGGAEERASRPDGLRLKKGKKPREMKLCALVEKKWLVMKAGRE